MAETDYDGCKAYGCFQIFLALLCICFGAGELMVGVIVGSHELRPCCWPVDPFNCARPDYPCFRSFMLGAGIWTGIFSTIDWYNFEYLDLDDRDYNQRVSWYYSNLSGLEGTLATVGILELLISIAILYELWNQQGTNQATNQILKIDEESVFTGGILQVMLTIPSIGVGLGDFILGLTIQDSQTCFRLNMLGAGIWTNIFFMIGGCLAISIQTRKTARRVGVLLTLSLLNTVIFAPALIFISIAGCIQNTIDGWRRLDWMGYPSEVRYFTSRGLEGTLVVAGIFEFILSLTISVTCSGDEPATNQVSPMPETTLSTTVPAAVPAAPRPNALRGNISRPEPTPKVDEPSTPAPPTAPTLPPVDVGLDVQYARRDLP